MHTLKSICCFLVVCSVFACSCKDGSESRRFHSSVDSPNASNNLKQAVNESKEDNIVSFEDGIISYEVYFSESPYPNEDKCKSWSLPRKNILLELIFSLTPQPNPYAVNTAFSYYKCKISGELKKGGIQYTYYFNAGGFVELTNSDTTFYLGCEKGDTCVKHFLGRKFTNEELEDMMEGQ